ncbi:MAG: hypothetical protein M3P40_00060 [Actinomycetota bacterium]|nr:hypothetical protein [Actinomycetota bacterium]
MQEVISGVLHWQAQHPNIGMNVSSYLLTDTGTALDPLLPNGESPQWLEQPVNRAVLTVRHHLRSAPQLGVPILAHRDGLQEFDGRLEVQGFQAGDELAPGIRVLGFGRICPDDTVLHITAGPGVLAFGDGIVNYGGLGHPPDQFLGEDPDAVKANIVEGLEPLLEEEFDVLLFAHGAPVARGGKQMLRNFVAERGKV